jgi:hypothetical protein
MITTVMSEFLGRESEQEDYLQDDQLSENSDDHEPCDLLAYEITRRNSHLTGQSLGRPFVVKRSMTDNQLADDQLNKKPICN